MLTVKVFVDKKEKRRLMRTLASLSEARRYHLLMSMINKGKVITHVEVDGNDVVRKRPKCRKRK